MLEVDKTALLIIDVQDRLYRAMHEKEVLAENIEKLIRGVRVLGIPVIATEQYPQGIGPTIPKIATLLDGVPVISKLSFSCCGDPAFLGAFTALNRKQVLIAGIECHVCVYQTTMDLLDRGHEVQIVADGVSSRTAWSRDIGLQKMRDEGAKITSTEIVLFELLKSAGAAPFREISQIIKSEGR
jgi:nicotinamidase-related amidase